MKKSLMILLAVLALSVSVRAEAIEDVTGNRLDRLVEEMKDNWHRLFEGATLPSGLTITGTIAATSVTATGEVTADGKYAVVGGDATTGLMVQKAAVSSTAGVLQTNTFAVVFGAAPTVVATYTEDPGDVRPLNVESVSASNCVIRVTADKNFAYVATGTRP